MRVFSSLPEEIKFNGVIYEYYHSDEKQCIEYARQNRLRYRTIGVLSRKLRGTTDLYGARYKPTMWVFVERKNPNKPLFQSTIDWIYLANQNLAQSLTVKRETVLLSEENRARRDQAYLLIIEAIELLKQIT